MAVRDTDGVLTPSAPLLWRASVVQLGFAAEMLAAPALFQTRAYAPVAGYVTELGLLFAVGGVTSLAALAGLIPSALLPLVPVIAAAPIAVLALTFVQTGVVTGSVGWGIEVVALLYSAWCIWRATIPRFHIYPLFVGALLLFHGATMVASPATFQNRANYADFGQYLAFFMPLTTVAGLGLIVSEMRGWRRGMMLATGLASLELFALVTVFATTHVWTGVLSYGTMATVLMITTFRRHAAHHVPVLLLVLAGIGAAADLFIWLVGLHGPAPLAADWSTMRPAVAAGVLACVAGYWSWLRSGHVRWMQPAAASVAVALGFLILANVAPGETATGGAVLLGTVGEPDLYGPWVAGLLLIVLATPLALLPILDRRSRTLAVLAAGSIALAVPIPNVLPYLLPGPPRLRLHCAIAFGAIAVSLLIVGAVRLPSLAIGERVLVGFGVLVTFVLAYAAVANAAITSTAVSSALNVMLVAILLATAGTALLMTRTITHPIAQMLSAIERFRDDRSARADVGGEDEISELAATFDRVAAENAAVHADLERLVDQRTAELRAANRELESFAYSVSHDLRAPLRAIEGFTNEILESGDHLSERSQHDFDRVRAAARNMGDLIDDLLDLSRLTRQTMSIAPVDVTALAAAILAQLRAGEGDRDVAIEIEPGMRADADERLLRVALTNLLNNAWKFTCKSACARIRIGTERHGNDMVFVIEDNGAGFDMRHADKLFAPFQRLHSGAEFEGSGIGLATVQRVIARHGGSVWAEGAPGKGATFRFMLAACAAQTKGDAV